MERLDLSTYAKDIKSYYNSVVQGEHSYAIFTTGRDSALKPTSLEDGDIKDFVSEFEEGSVQFGIIAINPFGSDVKKMVLVGWCPDSAPLKSKVSYATNFSEVGKIMHYHVDITARDSDDLDVDDIMKKVSTASGARYSIQSLGSEKSIGGGFKPKPKAASPAPAPIAEKPKPIPPKVAKPLPPKKPEPVKQSDEDEWDGEEESEIRDFNKKPLETIPAAYKPVKVDINALRNETSTKTVSVNPSGGLTSLPKHKPSGDVLNRYAQPEVVKVEFGAVNQSFGAQSTKDTSKLVGGMSKNFGANGGLTPAQQWAAKKGKFTAVSNDEAPVNSASNEVVSVEDDLKVNDAKSKFEKLSLDSEDSKPSAFPPPAKEESRPSVFPPPAKEEAPKSSVFPPPPQRSTPPVANEWSDEEEEEEKEEPTPAPLPARTTPAPATATESAPAPAPLPARPTTSALAAEETLPSAIAEYDYEKDEDNEIGFTEGELIIEIKFVDDDWWMGTNSNGESGLFPSTYVTLKEVVVEAPAEVESPVAAPASTPIEEPKSTGLTATAEYDYEATEDNELTFAEGDVITNIEKVDEDWWLGDFNGDRKLFPANYVTLQ